MCKVLLCHTKGWQEVHQNNNEGQSLIVTYGFEGYMSSLLGSQTTQTAHGAVERALHNNVGHVLLVCQAGTRNVARVQGTARVQSLFRITC
jgi:hypothetical protein